MIRMVPLNEEAKDFLAWVGGDSYSRESMIQEAQRIGVCRRVPYVPEGLVKGVSRVFFISDMNETDRRRYKDELKRRDAIRYQQRKHANFINPQTHAAGPLPRGTPMVFAYFTVRGITVITEPESKLSRRLRKLGVEEYPYNKDEWGFNKERHCGSLEEGGVYLLSEENMAQIRNLALSESMEGQIEPIEIPARYADNRFRGVKAINRTVGDRLAGLT